MSQISPSPRTPPDVKERHPGVVSLIEKLKLADPYFDYNVPPMLLARLDTSALIEHIERTYAAPEFIIQEPSQIQQYAQPSMRVINQLAYTGKKIASADQYGIVARVNGPMCEVKFENGTASVDRQDLVVTSYKPPHWFSHHYPASGKPSAVTVEDKMLRKAKVLYQGEDIYERGFQVPVGAEGMIIETHFNVDKSKEYVIAWEQAPQVMQRVKSRRNDQGRHTRDELVTKRYNSDTFFLRAINLVDYDQIRAEVDDTVGL